MKKLVSESLNSILKPKSQEEVTGEIKRRLAGKDLTTVKPQPGEPDPGFIIYKLNKAADIADVVRNMGGKDEDIFFNFYLILDNTAVGYKQVIGIKVSPDGTINAIDAKGNKVEPDYLEKFS